MRPRLFGLALFILHVGVAGVLAGAPPYIGDWSNGHGDTLAITKTTVRFNADPAVPYHDITKAGDDKSFQLELTSPRDVNGFDGKFLAVSCEEDEMRIVTFGSRSDLVLDKNPRSNVTWYNDSGD